MQKGINEACEIYHVNILGGDTNYVPSISIVSTGIGTIIDNEKTLSRKNMGVGELLYSTGKLGLGNAFAYAHFFDNSIKIKYQPKAKLKESKLIQNYATACMDTSDGLFPALSILSEINNIGFEVLRSEIRKDDWKKVGFVPGFGTTTEYRSYNFLDESVAPGNYSYRLKQIDFSGEFEYSDEIEVEVNFPDKFSLEQNYPNPFNPSTIIQYAVSSKQLVQIKVFDVLGNEIMTLVDEEKSAGTYEIEFSAEGLASGIYIYKMQTGSFVDIKKMSLIR